MAESSVGSMTMLGKLGMAESGLGGLFWFCACCNVIFKQSIGTMPFEKVFGTKKDVAKFSKLGCLAYIPLNKDSREKERHSPKAVEAVNLGFATDCNTSGNKLYIEEDFQPGQV